MHDGYLYAQPVKIRDKRDIACCTTTDFQPEQRKKWYDFAIILQA